MFQIAPMRKSPFSLSLKSSRTRGLEFLLLRRHRRISTLRRAVQSQLSPRFHFAVEAGRNRKYGEPSISSLNNKVPFRATSSNHGIDLQSPATESAALPLQSEELFHRHPPQDVALDKFTHFALNSHTIPLGSMRDDNWLDVFDAIDAWLNIGGGFAVDSAERLLERLLNEQAASFSKKKSKLDSSYSHRTMILADLQKDILNAWIEVFYQSEGNSRLAISRSEQALLRLLDKPTIQSHFPIEEYISVVEGYLHHHRNHKQGLKNAGMLLLKLSSNDNDKLNASIEDFGARIGPIYEDCATQLFKRDSTGTMISQLLKAMSVLKESRICPEINIPDARERITPEDGSRREENLGKSTTRLMSPFEVEVAEKRLVDVLNNASDDERNTIEGLVQQLATTKPSTCVIVALLEYFIKIGDSESASHWLQNLEPSILVSSYDLVERVLELWLAQRGSKVPWRADEVLKAVTRKIQEYDENFTLSTESFELIVDIWSVSEDPSASRKVVEWYVQMTSRGVKPGVAMLKMTVRALSGMNVDNSVDLVSNDLIRNLDGLSKGDKVEIVNEVLEVIALKKGSLNMILKLLDQFRGHNVISDEHLLRSSLSVVGIDTSPSDVWALVHYFDNTSEDIDLSLYALAIDTLFKLKEDARTEIQSLFDYVMRRMMADRDAYDPNDFSEFLHSVTAMHVHRKFYSEAESCLNKAENLFLPKAETTNSHSIIPLKCYKKLIVRKWYTAKTAQKVEESFEKLMELYRSGYSNLQPDGDIYTAYIDARAVRNKSVEQNLEKMIEQYKSSGKEEMKPQAKVFNTVLLSLAQNKRKVAGLYNKSIHLLNLMSDLEVQPDMKTINLVLKNTMKGNRKNSYEISITLMKVIEKYDLIPDTHTLHLIMDSCGWASSDDREHALKRCLSTFGDIRKQNFVGPITYGVLSKVIYRLASRDDCADKVGQSLLSMCCDDGMLTAEVRGRFKSMMSHSAWEKAYARRLSSDKIEPADWSRNIETN